MILVTIEALKLLHSIIIASSNYHNGATRNIILSESILNKEELANCVTCGCKKRAFYSMMTYRQLLDFLQSSLLHTSLNCPVHLINLFSSVIFLETLTFFAAVGWGSLDLLTPRLPLS